MLQRRDEIELFFKKGSALILIYDDRNLGRKILVFPADYRDSILVEH